MPYCWILYFWMASTIVMALSFPLGQMRSKGYYAFTVFFIAANGVLAWITPNYSAIDDYNAACRERACRQLVELRQEEAKP